MIVTKETVKAFRNLPDWVKREMKYSADVGYIYSGNELLGWSWSPNIKSSTNYNYGFNEDREIIASEPNFYINYMKDLMFSISEDVDMIIRGEQGNMEFGISLVDKDGDKEEILAKGSDRIDTLLNLLNNVTEFYYVNKCPSLNDIYSKDAYQIMSVSGIESKKPDIDIFENDDGEYCLNIKDYFTTVDFLNRFSRFIEKDDNIEQCLDMSGEWCHGRINMMEGIAKIYSNYGIKPNLTLPISYSSGLTYNQMVPSITFTAPGNTNISPGYFTTGPNSQQMITTGTSNQKMQIISKTGVTFNSNTVNSSSKNIAQNEYSTALANIGKIKYRS